MRLSAGPRARFKVAKLPDSIPKLDFGKSTDNHQMVFFRTAFNRTTVLSEILLAIGNIRSLAFRSPQPRDCFFTASYHASNTHMRLSVDLESNFAGVE